MMRIKKEIRAKLKKPLGKVYKNFDDVLPMLYPPIFCVGDRTTYNALKKKIPIFLAIFDLREKRKPFSNASKLRSAFSNISWLRNPPGNVPLNLPLNTEAILVDGEEDLLVLSIILNFDKGVILYGQPGEGVVLVKITNKLKEKIKNLIFPCKIKK